MEARIRRSVRELLLKIASYGAMHLVVAVAVAFAISRDLRLALAIGLVEPFFQTLAYSVHDRVWHALEKRRMEAGLVEAAEAVSSRLTLMDPEEQERVQGPRGHSHALPRSFRQVALKTLSYGLMHLVVAVSVAYALTGDLKAALAIGLVEPLVQTVFFTFHDRYWSEQAPGTASA